MNSIYKYINITWSGVFIVVTFLLSHISDPIILLFFFFLLSFFSLFLYLKFNLDFMFSISLLFSINCAFSVSFLVLMFALKFMLLNKSDWKCRTIENSLLWQKVSDDNYFWSNLESRFVSISHNCSTNMVLFHFHSVYYI